MYIRKATRTYKNKTYTHYLEVRRPSSPIGNFTGSWVCRWKSSGRASAGFRLRHAVNSD